MINIDKTIKNIGALGILVLILSLVRIFVYYQNFRFNILPFISLSEIPKYIIDVLVPIIAFMASMIFFKQHIEGSRIATHENLNIIPKPENREIKKSLDKYTFMTASNWAKSVMSCFLVISIMPNSSLFIISILVICSVLVIADLYILSIIDKYDYSNLLSKNMNIKGLITTSNLLAMFVTVIVIAHFQGLRVEDKRYSFDYNKQHIETTKDNYFIGCTEGYLFLYRDSAWTVSTYRINEIKNLKSWHTNNPSQNK